NRIPAGRVIGRLRNRGPIAGHVTGGTHPPTSLQFRDIRRLSLEQGRSQAAHRQSQNQGKVREVSFHCSSCPNAATRKYSKHCMRKALRRAITKRIPAGRSVERREFQERLTPSFSAISS